MVLTRWDPLYEIRRARRLANRRWAGFPTFAAVAGYFDGAERQDWSIPLDIVRDGDNVTVKASLPGVKPEDIDVTIEDGVLTIKADTNVEEEREDGGYVVRERRAGSFHRSLRLSDHVDTDKVEPRYENGVLTITLPVAESKKAKHLTVAVGAALPEAK
ncbi:MAG: Hsp20/alpha crystallin family protein [Chloroflexi bacterium]|nr:Hsp20/alpha crystallin family protein [Chloroflexota bacterium]MCI0801695.1 Hsp20/alpha crystallin family protein [Chloroflexota bacterium]MCI0829873.1 Hsp20/alpha crystallin family protein [Chloroflexota bacterium]MCI0849016.1 Hsp20/alpha crystallin family protein [Chloroflexota bacterium]